MVAIAISLPTVALTGVGAAHASAPPPEAVFLKDQVSLTASTAMGVVITDAGGSALPDLVLATGDTWTPSVDNHLYVYTQLADGTLSTNPTSYAVTHPVRSIAAGSLVGDSRADVVVATSAGLQLFTRDAGGLTPSLSFTTPALVYDVHAADMNGDGLDDIL
jgi:hypothetical protein